jgi:hypothetical protein
MIRKTDHDRDLGTFFGKRIESIAAIPQKMGFMQKVLRRITGYCHLGKYQKVGILFKSLSVNLSHCGKIGFYVADSGIKLSQNYA